MTVQRAGVLRAEHQPVAADRDVQQVGQAAVRVGVARDQQLHQVIASRTGAAVRSRRAWRLRFGGTVRHRTRQQWRCPGRRRCASPATTTSPARSSAVKTQMARQIGRGKPEVGGDAVGAEGGDKPSGEQRPDRPKLASGRLGRLHRAVHRSPRWVARHSARWLWTRHTISATTTMAAAARAAPRPTVRSTAA